MASKSKRKPVSRKESTAVSQLSSSETVQQPVSMSRSSKEKDWWICVLLAVATLSVYAPVVRHQFVNFDDNIYVLDNPHVNSGLNWHMVRWALTAFWAGNWHPLTWFSHALDCQVFGLYPGGHHISSLLLHVANVVLLFLLLKRVTGHRVRSLIVAGLFALHPFNVESVAWVAERKNLLCTFFFLLTLGAYGWYAQKPRLQRYLCVAGLFMLSLASKPMVITLPFVLLLVDFWPLGRIEKWSKPASAFPVPQLPFSRLALEKLPLLALSCASAVITIIAQRHLNAVAPLSVFPFTHRVMNALYSYVIYLEKIFLPHGFAVFYPVVPLSGWQVSFATLFLIAACFVVWKVRPGRPYLVAGGLWFLGTLVPVIGLLQVGSQSMADRYVYIPMIGILTALVWMVFDIADSKKIDVKWVLAGSAGVLVVLATLTWHQLGYWRSSYDLWTRNLAVTVTSYVNEENLAAALVELDRDDEAYPHFMRALRYRPDDPTALLNVGNYLLKHGRSDEAVEKFQTIIRTSKDSGQLAGANRGLGIANVQLGDPDTARKDFVAALQQKPESATDFYNLSMLETMQGVEKMKTVVSAHPSARGYLQLGQLLQAESNIPDARAAFKHALQIDPKFADAKQALHDLQDPDPPPAQ